MAQGKKNVLEDCYIICKSIIRFKGTVPVNSLHASFATAVSFRWTILDCLHS